MKRFYCTILFLALLWPCSVVGQDIVNELTIGTASPTGVYFQIAYAFKKMVQRQGVGAEIKVLPLPSEGSDVNIENLLNGKIDFGIVQSDRLYMAVEGSGPWAGRSAQELRTVMVLHPESITLLATESSGIKTLADLEGKRVNIGNPGSGTRENVEFLLRTVGLWDQIKYMEKAPVEAIDDLIDKKIDALFLTVGHPNLAVREATSAAHVRIVPIDDQRLLASVESRPYLSQTTIPVGFYPKRAAQEGQDVPSVGVRATLVTRADQADQRVYALTIAVLADLSYFRRLHPALAELTSQKIFEGLVAPLHSGAVRGYRETDLIKN